MRRTTTYLFALLVAVVALGYAAWRFYDVNGGAGSGTAAIGGPFTLVDQYGKTRTRDDFAGQYRLIYFGYTFCPDACPTALWAMTQALDQLAQSDPAVAKQVTPIFITIDPARDTVEHMKTYAASFHPRLVALTGTPQQVAQAAKAYRVFYRKVPQEGSGDYLMDHSSFIFLMSPDGRYLAHATHQTSPDDLAKLIDQTVKKNAG
ncbi:protein SCO1/2 [Tistlia consotensis]|uniref:Protein SCO1/2 n=1 Tax=Tistlia consotensis USBA 355 TaxID=560819 RepID=A0A1Y6B7K2_9PROT|nr:SCO family protein [Tistlia consotensis]SME94349.1 protein SCO1/2 [Tistlia consotensis USBA 355]SNR29286.1 protein SCO1/2 [Tistlia consotensis]